jgi:tRNA pseudouridine38-40 synthase
VQNYRLRVAYDGTGFHGWQRQPACRTVQGVLEAALAALLGVDEVTIQGAGRTDAGVHARGQVASFRARTPIPGAALRHALAPRLPRDVRVLASARAPDGFDARRSAGARRYSYRLLRAEDPLEERFAWRPGRWPEPAALAAATRVLEGRQDFSSFRSTGSSDSDPVCDVRQARWVEWESGLRFEIVADHFLYRMVRSIVGTALEVGAAGDPAGRIRAVIGAGDRSAAGPTAPARGLCLEEVVYPGVPSWSS